MPSKLLLALVLLWMGFTVGYWSGYDAGHDDGREAEHRLHGGSP
jgi:hypothetical protein